MDKYEVVLGIDPDTKVSGLAIVIDGVLRKVGVVDIRHHKLKGTAAAGVMGGYLSKLITELGPVSHLVVEGQQIYSNGRADGNNLLTLALVSGACLGAGQWTAAQVTCPKPRDWKGQRPKGASQSAILDKVGWEYEFHGSRRPPTVTKIPPEVEQIGTIPKAHMKEVIDAVGLALWGSSVRP